MWVAQTIEEARQRRRTLGGRVALVPTMGALHAGHLALIEGTRRLADHALVSIFVNPAQFGPGEDFEHYPRPLAQDLELCRGAGAAGVFAPPVAEMYPPQQTPAAVNVPALAAILEGEARPTHFAGVCRVVLKLFNILQPDTACFGMKDLQQLRVVQALAADLAMAVQIAEMPTVREPDGLALSSRNAYLAPEQRRHASGLFKALREAELLIERDGETDPQRVEGAMRQVLAAHQIAAEYAVVRHPQLLTPLDCIEPALTGGVAALVAGRLGAVRLIDNMILGGGQPQQVGSAVRTSSL